MPKRQNPPSSNRPQNTKPAAEPLLLPPAGATGISSPDETEIARRAYSRWENSDRSHGRDQDHWFAAEADIRGTGHTAQDDGPSEPTEADEDRR